MQRCALISQWSLRLWHAYKAAYLLHITGYLMCGLSYIATVRGRNLSPSGTAPGLRIRRRVGSEAKPLKGLQDRKVCETDEQGVRWCVLATQRDCADHQRIQKQVRGQTLDIGLRPEPLTANISVPQRGCVSVDSLFASSQQLHSVRCGIII